MGFSNISLVTLLLVIAFEICTSQESLFHTVIYHQLMQDRFYPFPNTFSTPPSDSGAISANIDYDNRETTIYYIELQRYVGNWVSAGVVLNNNDYINTGYLIANWGFDQQATDGSGTFPGTQDGVHSTSLFLEATSRAAIVLKNKGLNTEIDRWLQNMTETARYMIDPATTAVGKDVNLDPFTHRFFLRACAAEMTAFLMGGDAVISSEAKKLVEEGLTKQDPITGVLPERDGFDFNYQLMSLTFLGRYYFFASDADLKTRIIDFMNKALPSIMQRVDGLGNIDLSDSTRITEIGRNGKQKTLDWANIYQGLVGTCLITGNEGFCKLRDLLMVPILIVGYNFNIQENGIKSLGRDALGVIYARTPENVGDSSPLGDPQAVGVTEKETDFAYDMTGTAGMGVANGKFAYTKDLVSIDGLLSMTFTGWFKTDVGQVLGNNVDLFKTKKFRLKGVNNGHLKLYVDSENNEADSIISTNADWADVNKWVYFAVSYDGTKTTDNVKFYKGAVNSPIVLSSTQTLNKGSVDVYGGTGLRLYISGQATPFDGYLDDMRIYGSKDNNEGSLSMEQLTEAIAFDFKGVEGDGTGDPHIHGFDGILYYFHGENEHNYIVFGQQRGDTLVGKVRSTNELLYGVNKTYFSELGLRISSTRDKIRFSLQKVEKGHHRFWAVKVEVNGIEVVDNIENSGFSLEFNATERKVRVETKKFKFSFRGVSLSSIFRRHLDFSVSVKGVPSIKDRYIGVLGMTLSRRLGSEIHEELYKDFNQSEYEFAMRRHYSVGETSLHPNIKLWNMP